MRYTVKVPPTWELGSYVFTATSRKDALDEYNRSRQREGRPPIGRMPNGTTYKPKKG